MSVRDMHGDDCLGEEYRKKLEVSNLLSNKRVQRSVALDIFDSVLKGIW
jgi:hypothetical protein